MSILPENMSSGNRHLRSQSLLTLFDLIHPVMRFSIIAVGLKISRDAVDLLIQGVDLEAEGVKSLFDLSSELNSKLWGQKAVGSNL